MAYYYDQNGSIQPQKPHKNDNDIGSWIGIAVLFLIGLWPIGLILLISKLTDDDKKKPTASAPTPKKRESTLRKITKTPQFGSKGAGIMKAIGIALLVWGGFSALSVLGDLSVYLSHARGIWELISDLFYPVGLLSGGAAVLLGGRSMTRRQRRFAKYLAVAGSDQTVPLSRLMRSAEVSEKKLHHDLEIMVEKGLWGQEAYVDTGAGMLFRTREAMRQYEAQRTASAVPREAAEGYSGILRQIHAANDRIADPMLSRKIDRLEELTGRILRMVEKQPDKKNKAATFLNYYLPTTQKLLNSYAEFEEAGISGTNLDQAKAKIERTMDNIVAGFERQLDELYRDEAMDIDSDIRVMETMLRRDSASAAADFGLNDVGE